MGKLSIAYLGNYTARASDGSRFNTEAHISETLTDMGHSVIELQENQVNLPDILQACRGADLLLWTKTGQWLKCNGFEMLARLRKMKVPSIGIHLDKWWGLERENEIETSPFFQCDVVCTADGSSPEKFKKAGVNHFWIPPGVLKRECYIAPPRDDLKCDVAFVGSRGYHAAHYRGELISWLEKTYGARFRLFGANGDSWRGDDLNRLYASCRVIVGDSCNVGWKEKNYWSDRAPETTGRGGFLLHPFVDGMQDVWTDKEHIRYYQFGDFGGLKSLIDYHLDPSHDAERRRIQLAGHERTKAVSTYHNRMESMLSAAGELEPKIAEQLSNA